MTQADNRAASGTKRARSEGPRGDGDWTCPMCGNVNFAFRSTCNMRKCGVSKPVDNTAQLVFASCFGEEQRPLGPPSYEPPPAMFMGPGVPPPLPMGMSGMNGMNGMNGGYAPLPMVPQNSGVPYEYGAGMNIPGSYSPLQIPGYPATMIGSGPTGYSGPVVDGYGMGLTMVRPPFNLMQIAGPRPGVQIEENGSRKRRGGPEGASEGDWICPKCGNSNFAFRTFCNMRKCGTPKPAEPVPRIAPLKSSSQGPTPEGSWTCDACGNVNYPFRTKCNRRNCGVDKPADAKLTTASTTSTASPPSE